MARKLNYENYLGRHEKEYLGKVAELQRLVRENVTGIVPVWTRTFMTPNKRAFHAERAQADALRNWGVREEHHHDLLLLGHCWATVTDARFRQDARFKSDELIERMGGMHKLLMDIRRKIVRKGNRLAYGELRAKNDDELDEIDSMRERYLADPHGIIKGALSPSFISSLVYRLKKAKKEQSGD